MSHPLNDQFLERMHERFDSSRNGTERVTVLCELRENGFTQAVDSLIEEWRNERELYLDAVGVVEEELLLDDNGKEFFIEEEHEYAHPSDEGASASLKKVEVPYYLNVDYWLEELTN